MEAPAPTQVPDRPGERYLVIVPTYDERQNLPRIVPLVLAQDRGIEILVVDDNSPDGTGDLAAEMAEREPRLHVLRRPGKGGLGRAYLAGFGWGLERSYDLLIEMDADLSHPPDRLPALIAASQEADAVIGSRYVGGRVAVVNWPIARLFISYFGSLYARIITGVPIRDLTGGFNCWRRIVLESLDLSKVESNGYMFQIELKFRAWRRGFTMIEIPIVFTERSEGESKMSKRIVLEAVWKVWKIRFSSLFRRR